MHDFRYLVKNPDLNKADTYHISIQVCTDGLAFALLDPYQSAYLGVVHQSFGEYTDVTDLPDLVEGFIKKEPLLNRNYASTSCIICSSKSTLVPSSLYRKEHIRSYFEFNHQLGDLDELHVNYLKHLDAYLVFSVYHEIANVLAKKIRNLNLYSQATPFVENALLASDESEKVSVHFQARFFDIIVYRSQKLILHNSFSYRDPKDIIYFIMYVYDKLNLDPEHTPLLLSGNVTTASAEVSIIGEFFRNVSFAGKPGRYSFPPGLNKIPDHFLVNLYNLPLCE